MLYAFTRRQEQSIRLNALPKFFGGNHTTNYYNVITFFLTFNYLTNSLVVSEFNYLTSLSIRCNDYL